MARKELCHSCGAKIARQASFCPKCARPTQHATESQVREFEMGQWRRHLERTASERGASTVTIVVAKPEQARRRTESPREIPDGRTATQVAEWRSSRTEPPPRDVPVQVAPRKTVKRPKPKVKVPRPHLALPKIRLPKFEIRKGEEPVVDLETDPDFVYKACTNCNRTDWIVRTTRNSDATWNYWCVWCSRSFKTPIRLQHGRNPIVAASVVFFVLVAASLLLR